MSIDEWLTSLDADKPTRVSRQVLGVLSSQPESTSYAPAGKVAALAGVDVSSVTRVAQAVGYTGWPALRSELRSRYLRSMTMVETAQRQALATGGQAGSASLDADRRALARLAPDAHVIAAVVDAIASAGTRLALGGGSYGGVAHIFASNASLAGYPMSHPTESAALANSVVRLGKGDVVVVFDFWRLYESMATAVAAAARRGAAVCVITDHSPSEIADNADHLVFVSSEGGAYFTSLVAALAAANLICAELAARDPERTTAAIAQAEEGWTELHVMRRGQ